MPQNNKPESFNYIIFTSKVPQPHVKPLATKKRLEKTKK